MMDGAINIQEDFRNQPVSHPEKKIEVEKILDRPERPKSEVFSGLLKEQIDRTYNTGCSKPSVAALDAAYKAVPFRHDCQDKKVLTKHELEAILRRAYKIDMTLERQLDCYA